MKINISLPFLENQVISKASENIQTKFCSVHDSQISWQHDMGLRSLSVHLTMLPPVYFDSGYEMCSPVFFLRFLRQILKCSVRDGCSVRDKDM